MISLDPHRYDDFKNIYMDTVFNLLAGLGKQDTKYFKTATMLHFHGTDYPVAREIVWYLHDYGLYPVLTGGKTGFENRLIPNKSRISTMSDLELKEALRPLILGNIEALRNARALLLTPKKDGGFSREIRDVLTNNKPQPLWLRPGKMSNQICPATKAVGEKDPNLLDFIPYQKETEVRKVTGNNRQLASQAVKAIYALLDNRWGFLEYLYRYGYERLRDKKPECDNPEWKNKSISACLVSLLELRTCPYCNRNFIGTIRGRNLGYQLDHYINKSGFPLFCLSLYNLVPSCVVCNGGKGAKDEEKVLSPFEGCAKYDNDLDFYYTPAFLSEDEQGGIEIMAKVGVEEKMAERYTETISAFDLNRCYKFNKDEADDYIQKMIYYPPSMIRELGRTMYESENILLGEQLIETAMFGEGMVETEAYFKHPLSMMYRHLYRKYRE